MRDVHSNAELEAIHHSGDGLIFNAFSSGPTAAAKDNGLHLASCPQVERMLAGADPARAPSVRKVFFDDLAEACSRLARDRGPVGSSWKHCGRCRPDRPVISDDRPRAASRVAIPGRADSVFREAEVERSLYAHLRHAGYEVKEKVRVASGIVDAVATRDGERIVIEAKGEDSGGYASAQMNFQMAFGQISSRMTDPGATYAIAFPMTPDYLKVLRTFRGSLAFDRLNLIFYIVSRDSDVREIGASEIPAWIESLAQ
jgi:hypothetical protein